MSLKCPHATKIWPSSITFSDHAVYRPRQRNHCYLHTNHSPMGRHTYKRASREAVCRDPKATHGMVIVFVPHSQLLLPSMVPLIWSVPCFTYHTLAPYLPVGQTPSHLSTQVLGLTLTPLSSNANPAVLPSIIMGRATTSYESHLFSSKHVFANFNCYRWPITEKFNPP